MNDVLLTLGCLFAWYLYYGFECAINGASGGFLMPFKEWYRELTWNLPIVGYKHKLKAVGGDPKDVKLLPGPIHFLVVCVIWPLLPLVLLIEQ